jgi:WD40 repeat protein/serine/threonine protein kinase
MSDDLYPGAQPLPPELELRLDQTCDRFEDFWRVGRRPEIEDFVAATPEREQPALLQELVQLDAYYRRQHGEEPHAADYHDRFPALDPAWLQAAVTARPGPAVPVVPGYQILGVLGRGGMGIVYRARQVQLKRPVALKMILTAEQAGPGAAARLHGEAEAVAQLHHPNIVQIYEVGEYEGRPYFSMEFMDGGSLAEQIQHTPQPPEEAARLLATLARAVHHAHQQNIIHRDLKPANILLRRLATGEHGSTPIKDYSRPLSGLNGDASLRVHPYSSLASFLPKISDFGLAKRLGADGGPSLSGALLGTPSYMAPEQAARQPTAIGPPADVHALGAILYEMLTGQPAFRGTTLLDTLEQVRFQEPVPPSHVQRGVARDLETICLKCLRKEPAHRYASALHLAEDLGRWLRGEPIQARPVGAVERLGRWCRRNPGTAVACGVAGAALLAATLVSALFAVAQTRALKESEDQRRELADTKDVLEKTDAHRRRLARTSASLTLDQALRWCEQGQANRGLVLLAHSLQMVGSEDHDLDVAIRMNLAAWGREVNTLRAALTQEEEQGVAAWSPDGQTILTGHPDRTARLWSSASGQPLGPPLAHPSRVLRAVFRQDGKAVLIGCEDGSAQLWDVATGQRIGPPLRHPGPIHYVALSPNGSIAVTGCFDSMVQLWSLPSGQPISRPLRHDGTIWVLAFSPDSRLILTGGWDRTARLWDAATGRPLGSPLEHQGNLYWVAFSPNGKTFVTCSEDKKARLWTTAGCQPLGQPLCHQEGVYFAGFSPDGETIVTGSQDRTAQRWNLATHAPLGLPYKHQDTVNSIAFDRDGQLFLTGSFDHTARVWHSAAGQSVGSPLEHPRQIYQAVLSPDGRTALTRGADRDVRVWNIAPSPPDHRFLRHGGPVYSLAFSPDGQTVLTGSADKTARLWNAATGEPIGNVLLHPGVVRAVAFSPDGRLILTGCEDGRARLWAAASGRLLSSFLLYTDWIVAIDFSPDGQSMMTACREGTARVWQVTTGQPLIPPLVHPDKVTDAACSPDGSTIVTGCKDGGVRLWDARTGNLLRPPMQHAHAVGTVTFGRNGQTILTGCYDGEVRQWETATGLLLAPPVRHEDTVWGVALSPDGKTLATTGNDQTARLWNAATGKPIGPILVHPRGLDRLALSPNGKTLWTACTDGMVRRWKVPAAIVGKPDHILLWTQAMTGLELDANGAIVVLDAETLHLRQRQLKEVGISGDLPE